MRKRWQGVVRSWKGCLAAALLGMLCLSTPLYAIETLNESSRSYYNARDFQLILAAGSGALIGDHDIANDGFHLGMRFGFGFGITRRLRAELFYQFNILPIESPDPLSAGLLQTEMVAHMGIVRAVYRYDQYPIMPYIGLGVGVHQIGDLNPQTSLNFDFGLQLPMSVGFETYVVKDRFSLAVEYTYHVLFEEEQDSSVEALLGLNDSSFDIHTMLLQMNWYF